MKKKFRGFLGLVLACMMVMGILGACSNDGSKEQKETTNVTNENNKNEDNNKTDDNKEATPQQEEKKDEKNLSGALTLIGSTSMEKISNAAAEAFMNKYPKVRVSAEFPGSSAGVEAVIAGTTDIGNASRHLKDSEIEAGAVENIVAIDGIAVILEKTNTVSDLTKDQLTNIYNGTIKNWSEVGGSNQPIVVIGRESGSGTRGAFEEILKLQDLCQYSNEINSTGGVMAKVASTPGSIGYVSLDVLDDTVVAVNLDGVEPTEENIKAGKYFLSRPFVMATVGEISEQSELVQAFFDFMYSQEGKDIVKAVGLITVD